MLNKYAVAAFALQFLVEKASAGVAKRADDGPITLTRTVTHNSYYGSDGTPTAVTDTETIVPTVVSSIVDGTTIWVDTTITLGCSYCEAHASETASVSLTESVAATTTGDSSSSETDTSDDDEDCPTDTDDDYSYTTPGASEAGSTVSTAEAGEATTSAAAEETTVTGEATGAGSSVEYTDIETTASTAAAEETTISGEATGAGSSAEYTISSVVLGTGGFTYGNGNSGSTQTGIFTNSTRPATPTGENSPETTGDNSAETGEDSDSTETGGLVITQTVTADGSVTTEISTVTQIITQPIIIVIRQVTIFTFTFALGGNCPSVQHNSGGGFVVGSGSSNSSETHSSLDTACSSACYLQFEKCSLAAGKNFDLTDCENQLNTCLSSAATHTVSDSSASTVTQSVILPTDATTAVSSYVNGATVISTRTLTVSEVCTVGTDGVGIVTVTSIPASLTSALASEATTSVPMVETTKAVTVSYVNAEGSTITSYTTMTLTVPCTKCAAGTSETEIASASETEIAVTQTGENGETVSTALAGTATATGAESSHISVITLTNTVPNSNGQGSTIVYSESTLVIPTGTGTAPYGTGVYETKTIPGGSEESSVSGSQTGEIESATSSSGSESSHVSVITFTNTVSNSVVYSESTFAIPTGTETAPYGTGVYTEIPSTETDQAGCTTCGGFTEIHSTSIDETAITITGAQSTFSSAEAGSTEVSGSVTEGDFSTSLITMSIPASGTHPATYSVITMTISGSYGATGTGAVPEATVTETAGNGEDITSYVTMTMSPTCAGCSAEETVITVTATAGQPGETVSTALAGTETETNFVQTNYVTVTMGDSTGVVTMTMTGTKETQTITAPGKTETVYVTGGTKETVYVTEGGNGGKTVTVTGDNSGATVTVTGGSKETVTVTAEGGNGGKTVTVTGGSEKTVTVTAEGGNGGKTVTVTGGSEKTVTVTAEGGNGGKTVTVTGGSYGDKTVTITQASVSTATVTVTQNCENGQCSDSAQTVTVTGSCEDCTACAISEAAATTLATSTSKARETVYVTATVNQAINTAPAKWRRVIGF